MLGDGGWEIIKSHDKWIDTRGVNLGGPSKAGRRLQLVDARGVVKNRLDGKNYLVIIRQAFYNSNSDETLLAEDQIECHGVQVLSRPRVFGGPQKVIAKDQFGRVVNLAIDWDGSTRYLNVRPPTRAEVSSLRSLEFTSGDPYLPYSPSGRISRQLKLMDPCTTLNRVKYIWTDKQITEWCQRLGYISPHLVKKTFESSTQFYPGVRHEREVMPKKAAVGRFPAMSDSLRSIRRNKETFSVDLLVDTRAGSRWGIVFFGLQSKLLAYYRLGKKEPTSHSTLDALRKFIAWHGIPKKIITDSDKRLGAGKTWKRFLSNIFVPLILSEPEKHNQNFVERAIQNLKAGQSKIRNACGFEVSQYYWEMMDYLSSLNNYVARASLGQRSPFEAFWGETPDISMIRFKFWEPVYYRNWIETAGKVLMHPGRFVGFAWATGDPMTFKVLQCNVDPKVSNRILHRGTVVPRAIESAGYNSALQPKSDAYFPVERPYGGTTGKAVPSVPLGTVNPPDNAIAEGGRKRNMTSSQPSSERSGRPAATSSSAVDMPSSTGGYSSASDDQGDMSGYGATDERAWDEMDKQEVQDQYNCTDQCDGNLVEIKSHYWHPTTHKLWIRTDPISGIEEDRFEADEFRLDHAGCLALYIMESPIGRSRAKNVRTFLRAKEWREWADRHISNSKKRIARLVRIYGNDSLDEITGSQVTIAMMRPLRFHRLRLARLKKPSGRDRRPDNSSGLKYGIRVPRNAKEALEFDEENGNTLWRDAILKELKALMEMEVFEKFPCSVRQARGKGFQFAPLRMIFDVKVDLRRKARLVIGGHVVDSSGHEVYASTMKSVSARVLMTIATANNLDVMVGDIGNAYLHATTEEKVYTRAGAEFAAVGLLAEGTLLEVKKALYGLPTSGNRWHAHLSQTLRDMSFKPTRFDPDVWIRGREGGYDYIGTHTDDVLVVAKYPARIFEKLQKVYTIKKFGPPVHHLGCDYSQVKRGSKVNWLMGSITYIKECLSKVCALLKVTSLRKEKLPCSPSDHPELDQSPLLGEAQHRLYQQLVGMAEWAVQIGRFDIRYALTSLNRFSAAPRAGHLKRLIKVFGYLQTVSAERKSIVVSSEDIREVVGEGCNYKEWLEKYPDAMEEIDEGLPEPRGEPITSTVYFDSDHAHDQVTRRSVSGIIAFIGSTPISWTSKRQGSIESSSYSAEFCAGRVACEEAIAIRYMLRSLGVPVPGPTRLCGDNLGMIMSSTNPDSELKKKHVAISFHKLRECTAARIVNLIKVDTTVNRSDILTKGTPAGTLGKLSDASYGVGWVE